MKFKEKGYTFFVYSAEVPILKEFGLDENFLKNLPNYFDNHGQTIHKARNEIKVFDLNGHKINVKKYAIAPIVNRILYSLGIRKSKCQRAFLNAEKILKAGFNTPKPLAFIIQRKNGLVYDSYFISEQLENVSQLGHNCKNVSLIKAFALFTAQLHEKGLESTDYTPGNILYSKQDSSYKFYLVDINRFKFRNKPLTIYQAPKTLYLPVSTETRLKLFISCYAKHRNFPKEYLINKSLFLKRYNGLYQQVKRILKKIPGAGKLTGRSVK